MFDRLTFDERYGGKLRFLRGVVGRNRRFVAEVPTTFSCWTQRPHVTERPFRRVGRGRPRKVPRLVAAARAPQGVLDRAENWPELPAIVDTLAALGVCSRPAATRACVRRASIIFC